MVPKEFIKNTCVKQGDILNPLLFVLVADDAIKNFKLGFNKYRLGYWRLKRVEIKALTNAD